MTAGPTASGSMMKAWRLEGLGGRLMLEIVEVPRVRPGSILVRVEATILLTYLKDYVEGRLPSYQPPPGAFTPGTNCVGIVEAVGRDVWQLKPGQRVIVSPHFVSTENVADPAQILIGLTAFGESSAAVQEDWRDGTLTEYVLAPAEVVTPVEGLDGFDPARLATLARFIVPFGGLSRGHLAGGETLIVTGASGAFGTAAVLLGVAMGAARVIAAGRNEGALAATARAGGPRVLPVRLTGDPAADAAAIRAAAGGPVDMGFDMVGRASDASGTLAALQSLRRGGRFVLMGSMTVPLPLSYSDVMRNNWEVIGQFMYPPGAYRRLLDLLRAGLLDISAIRPRVFRLDALPDAMEAAASAGNLECVVVRPS